MKVLDFKDDIQASIVVFLVALPLCLGIALASNAPIASGLIAGILGGIIVGLLSGSGISVSGPAAGLTVIVVNMALPPLVVLKPSGWPFYCQAYFKSFSA